MIGRSILVIILNYAKRLVGVIGNILQISQIGFLIFLLTEICNIYNHSIKNLLFLNIFQKLALNKPNMKPIEIINLEKELGIEIYLATNHESFTLNNEENTYFFEQGTVTGLSLLVSGKINFLNNFPDLKKLLIFGKIDDTSPISTLTKIEELHLEDNDLLSLEFLKALNQIKVLEIRHNNISDISILSNYTNLEKLNLWSNKITDISNLKNLKKYD